MVNTERIWNALYGATALVMGVLWLAGTVKTDPGLGHGWARDVGNVLAFYWMPVALTAGGLWAVVFNLVRIRQPN